MMRLALFAVLAVLCSSQTKVADNADGANGFVLMQIKQAADMKLAKNAAFVHGAPAAAQVQEASDEEPADKKKSEGNEDKKSTDPKQIVKKAEDKKEDEKKGEDQAGRHR